MKVANHRSHAVAKRGEEEIALCLGWDKEYFTPELEIELKATGSGRMVCPICCERFGKDGDVELVVLDCLHAYHFLCLEAYALYRQNSEATPLLCPVCQSVAISRIQIQSTFDR